MTIQETSRASYERLVAAGLLKAKQQRIMDVLTTIGTATSGEIIDLIGGVRNVNAWRGRFTELSARGLIREVSVRKCEISGRECIVWGPTGRDKPLDPHAGSGRRKHAFTRRKKGRWQAAAAAMAKVIQSLLDTRTIANSDHATECHRALAEYARLGGRVAS
ncbi:MAG TPA: hypothetical protein VLN57_21005 [Xanthobacteraceae bacterium]|nr:hypothetical protein [Xanthobacteraceae bacterium]